MRRYKCRIGLGLILFLAVVACDDNERAGDVGRDASMAVDAGDPCVDRFLTLTAFQALVPH
jgi:hypothetical protein